MLDRTTLALLFCKGFQGFSLFACCALIRMTTQTHCWQTVILLNRTDPRWIYLAILHQSALMFHFVMLCKVSALCGHASNCITCLVCSWPCISSVSHWEIVLSNCLYWIFKCQLCQHWKLMSLGCGFGGLSSASASLANLQATTPPALEVCQSGVWL